MSERIGPLLIRADGGSKIGGGHIMRCLALAGEWKKRGGEVVFVSHSSSDLLLRRIEVADCRLVALAGSHPDPSDLDTTMTILAQLQSTGTRTGRPWVVLDGYHFDAEYQSALRELGCRLLVIDDTAHLPNYHADILLNQNIGAHSFRYACDPDSVMLLGTRYCLLRPEFARWRTWTRRVRATASRVLVSLGAGDSSNATLKVVQALAHVSVPQAEVRVVVGPANSNVEEIRRTVVSLGERFQTLSDVTDMSELMAWADVAISGAGSTSLELCFMGLPALLMVLADNQTSLAELLEREAVAVNLGKPAAARERQHISAVENLMLDAAQRQAMCIGGRRLVDGLGGGRVVQYMLQGSFAA